jgi:hypothetical protein
MNLQVFPATNNQDAVKAAAESLVFGTNYGATGDWQILYLDATVSAPR